MPSTVTHYLFTKDVLKCIDKDVQHRIKNSEDIYNLFGNSFDILFFSNPKLGSRAHGYNTNVYFANMINYIRNNNLTNNSDVLAYLYGSICHYVLDSTIHPYVYYYTGKYKRNVKETYKYRGQHSYMEYMLDVILYKEKYNKELYKVNISKEIFPKLKFSLELQNILDYTFKKTFDYNNGYKSINRGRRNFKFAMKYGMSSRFGFRKMLLKAIDALHIVKDKKLSYCNFHIKKIDKSVLNLEHRKWCYPIDKSVSFHYSFFDLYDVSIEKARRIINSLNEALEKSDSDIKKVLREIGNNSYRTGLNISRKENMRYFNY